MTIFDALRYHISNPPTKEELAAVPRDVYHKWIISMGWDQSNRSDTVADYYKRAFETNVLLENIPLRIAEIQKLRKYLAEYNP